MSRCIITISREFGCGAREIARELASRLGVTLYDRDLVDMTAKKAGVNVEVIKESDEALVKSGNRLFAEFGYGSTTSFLSEDAIRVQAEVIRDIANQQESCVIFGRCADYILQEHPNVVNFFLYAPLSKRIKHIAENYKLTEPEAQKLIKRVDRQRHNYYKYVTGHNRGDRENKDLMIDVSTYGVKGTVDLMCTAIAMQYPEGFGEESVVIR